MLHRFETTTKRLDNVRQLIAKKDQASLGKQLLTRRMGMVTTDIPLRTRSAGPAPEYPHVQTRPIEYQPPPSGSEQDD